MGAPKNVLRVISNGVDIDQCCHCCPGERTGHHCVEGGAGKDDEKTFSGLFGHDDWPHFEASSGRPYVRETSCSSSSPERTSHRLSVWPSGRVAEGWADSLDAMVQADPSTRDSIWQGVSFAFSALADPRVLDAVSHAPGEEFDHEMFLLGNGTLYLLATGAGAGTSSALVAALIEDLVETARKIAARSSGARMDPPLLLALDEIGNVAPLPSLPTLMAEGGGTGITPLPCAHASAH